MGLAQVGTQTWSPDYHIGSLQILGSTCLQDDFLMSYMVLGTMLLRSFQWKYEASKKENLMYYITKKSISI